MLMDRFENKGANKVKSNMSETELLERLTKCQAIVNNTDEETIIKETLEKIKTNV